MRRLLLGLLLLATACGGGGDGDTTELRGASVDGNFRLSVGEARYVGLTPLTATRGKATLVSLRVEGPPEVEASVLLLDLTRTPAVVAGAVIDRTATVEVDGAVIDSAGPPRYAPTLAVRPRTRGTHRLTAVVAEYRAGDSKKTETQRMPISFTVAAG